MLLKCLVEVICSFAVAISRPPKTVIHLLMEYLFRLAPGPSCRVSSALLRKVLLEGRQVCLKVFRRCK